MSGPKFLASHSRTPDIALNDFSRSPWTGTLTNFYFMSPHSAEQMMSELSVILGTADTITTFNPSEQLVPWMAYHQWSPPPPSGTHFSSGWPLTLVVTSGCPCWDLKGSCLTLPGPLWYPSPTSVPKGDLNPLMPQFAKLLWLLYSLSPSPNHRKGLH